MRIFVFGSGVIYKQTKKWLIGHSILGILDNAKEKQGRKIDGIKVFPPEFVKNKEYDRIYVLSMSVRDMREQLLEIGVPEKKIFFVFDLIDLGGVPYYKRYDSYNKSHLCNLKSKKITLISHDFSTTGAPNCLLMVSQCLCKNGYSVTVASPIDGEMREKFLEYGADVIVDERLSVTRGDRIDWLSDCDLLFFNTVQLYYLLHNRERSIPTIWWIHEPPYLYKSVLPCLIKKIPINNLWIFSVSNVADLAFRDVLPGVKINRLVFGIPDLGFIKNGGQFKKNEYNFIVIGSVSKLKGHDILLRAIEYLKDEIRCKCRFLFIGNDESEFANQIKIKVNEKNLPVKCYGSLCHNDTLLMLGQMDALICASREETMSMAVMEAIMKGVPVIIPSKIGIAEYIKGKKAGCVFFQNDSNSLSECISFFVEHYDLCYKYRWAAREIYLKHFLLEKFENRLLDILNMCRNSYKRHNYMICD